MPSRPSPRQADQSSGVYFGLVIGVLLGVLTTMLFVPANAPLAEQQAATLPEGQDPPGSASGADVGTAGEPTSDNSDGTVSPTAAGDAVSTPQVAAPQEDSGVAKGASTRGQTTGGSGGAGTAGDASRDVRGVTDDAVRIGVAIPDLGAIRFLGPEFDNGDPEEQFEAILERWRAEGVVPLHGRDIEFYYRRYDVLSADSQRSACVGLVQDDKVFAVLGIAYFETGSECVAREFETPVLTTDSTIDETFRRSHPFMFSLGMSSSRLLRNLVHWADGRGLLDGRTIGVYRLDDARQAQIVDNDIRPALRRLGHDIEVVATTQNELGGPEDATAVQRFRSAGVDLAILLTSKAGFMRQAESQRYRPTYLESDWAFGTSDTAASQYPTEHFDGTYGLTGRRVGEVSAGMSLDKGQRACLDNFEQHAGHRPEDETAEWSYILQGCDLAEVLRIGLDEAASGLNKATLIRSLRTIDDLHLNRYAPISFTEQKHHGAEMHRTVQFHADCECWRVVAPEWQPLFVD